MQVLILSNQGMFVQLRYCFVLCLQILFLVRFLHEGSFVQITDLLYLGKK